MNAGASNRRGYVLAVLAGVLLFTAATTALNWVKYTSLRSTDSYDLGFYHNSAFNVAQGRSTMYVLVKAYFDRKDHEGPSVFRSNHFSPMRTLLLPQLYRLWPHVVTLFALQGLIIALGALPLYWFVAARTGAPGLGLAVAGSYLLHPAILHLGFNDFREIQLGVGPALFALAFHAARRPLPFVLAALLTLACRQEYVFLVALVGLMTWRLGAAREGRLRWALAPLLLAGLWALLTNGYYLYFYGRPWPLRAYAGASEPLGTLLLSLVERLAPFLRITLLPAVGGLLLPEALVAALPFVAGAKAVHWPAFPHHHLQHLSPALAAVFWAFAGGLVRLWPRLAATPGARAWTPRLLLAAALLSAVPFGWGAAQAYFVGGVPRYAALARLDADLPADATVMVPKDLLARFSGHTRVLTHHALPLGTTSSPPAMEVRAIFTDLVSICDLVAIDYVIEAGGGLEPLILASGRYLPAELVGRFRLYRARPDAPRPPDPDARLQAILRWDQMGETKRRWADLKVARRSSPHEQESD